MEEMARLADIFFKAETLGRIKPQARGAVPQNTGRQRPLLHLKNRQGCDVVTAVLSPLQHPGFQTRLRNQIASGICYHKEHSSNHLPFAILLRICILLPLALKSKIVQAILFYEE